MPYAHTVIRPESPACPEIRHRLVATLARAALVTCLARGSKIERLCRELASGGERTVIVADDDGAVLLGLQAPAPGPATIDAVRAALAPPGR
jgi:hypothetical protein